MVVVEGDVPRRSRKSSRLLLQVYILIWKRDLDFLRKKGLRLSAKTIGILLLGMH